MKENKESSGWWKLGLLLGAIGGFLAWRKATQPHHTMPFISGRQHGTALVTGASSGIGEAFARQLAKAGYNLVLVARRKNRLEALASELQQNYQVMVEVFPADLSSPSGVEQVEEHIRQLNDLVLLVNNAGFGTTGHLVETQLDKQIDMVHVHVLAAMRLTHSALAGMVARRRGAIINLSSIASFFPSAGNANYSASKAYLNSFSKSLQLELQGTGVYVQALCPGYTVTEFHDTTEYKSFDRSNVPQKLWMTPDAVVKESLASLGSGEVIFIPGEVNRFIVGTADLGVSTNQLREWGKWLVQKK